MQCFKDGTGLPTTVSPATPLPVTVVGGGGGGAAAPLPGAADFVTGQANVTSTSPSLIAGARAKRTSITISAKSAKAFYVGKMNVSANSGLYVAPGGAVTLNTTAAIYAISDEAVVLSYVEHFNV